MMKKRRLFPIISALVLTPLLFAQSAVDQAAEIKLIDSDFNLLSQIDLYKDYDGEFDIDTIDLGNDNKNEIVVARSRGSEPFISILRSDGSVINEFFAYDKHYRSGVKIATCDVNGDNRPEIITGTGVGGGPQVRIFDGYGNLVNNGFFAFNSSYRGGVNVACGDINSDGMDEIIAGSGVEHEAEVRIFNGQGEQLEFSLPEFDFWAEGQLNVETGDVDHDSIEEILIAGGKGNVPKVVILEYNSETEPKVFDVFSPNYRGGVNIEVGDYNLDSKNEIIVSASYSGGPHVQIFNSHGDLIEHFFAYDEGARTGVQVAVADLGFNDKAIITVPERNNYEGRTDLYKYIEIDISSQRMQLWENGYRSSSYLVSTGKWDMPTPLGEFKIWQKIPRAYSVTYELYMPWWMSFKPGYGIHELPEWPSGYKEGVGHLGYRVSHGCVRLGIGPAKSVYDWAPIGTTVVIHN